MSGAEGAGRCQGCHRIGAAKLATDPALLCEHKHAFGLDEGLEITAPGEHEPLFRLDGLDAQIELALGLHEVAQQHALPVAEREVQGVVECLDLLGDMTRQALEDHLARGTGNEAIEDGPAVGAEDIGKDAADPHPGTVNHPLDTVRLRSWIRPRR